MDRKIRVGAVSYLNTKPLIYGFERGMMKDELELLIDYPANIATKLLNNQIDIGLIPVAIIPQLKNYQIIGDYCIASDGEVASVCLFSEVPINEIETVLLDYQSRSSVALLKILLQEHWDIKPKLVNATQGYEDLITGTTAGLVIGDRAFYKRRKSKFIYDLGAAWKELTNKPFVFAAWVSNKPITPDFIKLFDEANQHGLDHLAEVIDENPFEAYDLNKYYTVNINFKPKFDKLEVITLFLDKLKRYK